MSDKPHAENRKKSRFDLPRVGRDGVLFVLGLGGVAHETLIANQERPTLLLLFATMIGLPAFLRADESRNGTKNGNS